MAEDDLDRDFSLDDVDQRLNRLGVKLDHGVTKQQVEALLSRYHWVQICGEGEAVDDMPVVVYEGERSGWDILFYGNAMSASPGFYHWLSEPMYDVEEESDGDGSADLVPDEILAVGRRGTIVAQAWNLGLDCLDIASRHCWESMRVVSGSKVVQRSLIHNSTIPVSGVALDERDVKILRIMETAGVVQSKSRPRRQ